MAISTVIIALLLTGAELTGTSVMPVLRIGQGPRGTALGEASVALADDASALYWNPAGLGQLPDYLLSFSHQQWFFRTHDEVINAVLPDRCGSFGLGLLYSAEPGIESWNEQNLPGDTLSAWNALLNIGYGLGSRHISVGAAAKGFYQNLCGANGYGGAVDIGLVARPLDFLKFGLLCRNIGTAWYQDYADLPTEACLGIAYLGPRLIGVADIVYPFDNDIQLRAGIEFRPSTNMALRLGYRTGPADISTLGWLGGLTSGLGFKIDHLRVDYSLAPYGTLGLTHRLGLQVLIPRQGRGAVRIRTVDSQTMLPIRADVNLFGIITFSSQTDRSGEMLVSGLRPGQLIINTSLSGYLSRIDTMDILGDREQSAIIALQPQTYGGIYGGVYDATTRRPMEGFVSYRGPIAGELTTDPTTGTFAVRELPVGQYVMTATAVTPGYLVQSCTVRVAPSALTECNFYLVRQR